MTRHIKFFLLAFLLNLIWEEAHSALYTHYRGGPVTHPLLLFMAVKDALMLSVLALFLRASRRSARYPILLAVAAFLVSFIVELHAISAGRWSYAPAMPIVPVLGIGLSPFLQLALTGYFSYRTIFRDPLTPIAPKAV